jgi:ribosome maturation factor RimP
MPPPRPAQARTAQDRPAQDRAARSAPDDGELRGVLEPVVAAAGFELDAVDVRPAGRRHTVRLVVDSDTGVGLDDIARLSRAASEELDRHEQLLGGAYTLEVTSPGVDRPLTSPRHWRRARRRLVAVRPQEGTPFRARVGDAGDDAVVLLVDGTLREVPYADVAHAAVEVEFNPPPADEIALLDPAEAGDDDAEDLR